MTKIQHVITADQPAIGELQGLGIDALERTVLYGKAFELFDGITGGLSHSRESAGGSPGARRPVRAERMSHPAVR
ncbi:hypothetical protein GCM10009425_47820 [Pseudomonas asuensis]|uniref:Uncharacterized protein n=1 Tax=Pseudomonas asuensis TaxID=1825787 RepID=A0ABQ2H3C8_9PSED|nr:hypothetical protein GCM10009425_47820 [Pseudomonas asuensis]